MNDLITRYVLSPPFIHRSGGCRWERREGMRDGLHIHRVCRAFIKHSSLNTKAADSSVLMMMMMMMALVLFINRLHSVAFQSHKSALNCTGAHPYHHQQTDRGWFSPPLLAPMCIAFRVGLYRCSWFSCLLLFLLLAIAQPHRIERVVSQFIVFLVCGGTLHSLTKSKRLVLFNTHNLTIPMIYTYFSSHSQVGKLAISYPTLIWVNTTKAVYPQF